MDGLKFASEVYITLILCPMKKMIFILACISCLSQLSAQSARPVWSKTTARQWYEKQGWLRGCDFIPSTAINQLEMWQAESFDTATISRELGYAQSIGLNCMRVFLHHLAWQQDPEGFKKRIRNYLDISNGKNIKTIFVFFDDCWNETYQAGTQPAPKPGVHNSGWIRDPGKLLYDDTALMKLLETYVKDILRTFRNDQRILLWDLYNEPGNSNYQNKSMVLLKNVFQWSREINPVQPLTAGVWSKELAELNRYQLEASDIISYHNYENEKAHMEVIDTLRKYGRPLVCTEYMARLRNSTFFNIMPMLKKENVAAINWGLVSGKTNTKYAWDTPIPDGSEPKIWFHDIFRPDGTPYSEAEIDLIRSLTGVKSSSPVQPVVSLSY
jgi:Glycosyl hydrolases family 2, TIM barrel domain